MSVQTKLPVVLIHGAFGFGRRRPAYGIGPTYWPDKDLHELNPNHIIVECGMLTSDHDRACEVFYQLYGGTIDYGKEHSEACGHHRFGATYEKPLHPNWGPDRPLHLVGHSMGGTTALELYQLIAKDHFNVGSNSSWVRSLTSIAAPLTGATFPHLFGIYDIESPLKLRAQLFCVAATTWLRMYQQFPFLRDFFDLRMDQWGDHSITELAGANMATKMNADYLVFDLLPYRRIERNRRLEHMDDIYLLSVATSHESTHTAILEVCTLLIILFLVFDPISMSIELSMRLWVGAGLLTFLIWRLKNLNYARLPTFYWSNWAVQVVTKSLPNMLEGYEPDLWVLNDGAINIGSMLRPWFPKSSEITGSVRSKEKTTSFAYGPDMVVDEVPLRDASLSRKDSYIPLDDVPSTARAERGKWYLHRVDGNHFTSTSFDRDARDLFETLFLRMKTKYENEASSLEWTDVTNENIFNST